MGLDIHQQPPTIIFQRPANGLHHFCGLCHVMDAVKGTDQVVTVVICNRIVPRIKK